MEFHSLSCVSVASSQEKWNTLKQNYILDEAGGFPVWLLLHPLNLKETHIGVIPDGWIHVTALKKEKIKLN